MVKCGGSRFRVRVTNLRTRLMCLKLPVQSSHFALLSRSHARKLCVELEYFELLLALLARGSIFMNF